MKSAGMRRVSRSTVHVIVALSLLSTGVGASAGAQRLAARPPRVNAPPTDADYQRVVDQAYAKFKDLKEGKNADYIPALAEVPSNYFGIALVSADGKVHEVGDSKQLFSIQSICKVFTAALVMQQSGNQKLEETVGVDASTFSTTIRFLSLPPYVFPSNK